MHKHILGFFFCFFTLDTTPLPPMTTMVTTVRVTANVQVTTSTISSITTTEDYDDESTSCHSGTGTCEDYEPTGNIYTLSKSNPYTPMDM